VTAFELEVIARLAAYHEPRHLFEIGTFDGRTTLNLASHSPPDAQVFTLDLPPSSVDATALPIESADASYIDKDRIGARFLGTGWAQRITQLYGDSGTFDFGPFKASMDFIFIDGAHSYDYVLSDSRAALEMAAPGATLLWHDYDPRPESAWHGVVQALDDLQRSDPEFSQLRMIVGTSIAHLQLPGSRKPRPHYPEPWADSSQPEHLLATLSAKLETRRVKAGGTLYVEVSARNIGAAAWLPHGAPVGPVNLGCSITHSDGRVTADYSRSRIPMRGPLLPGQAVRFTPEIPAPADPGVYTLNLDLVSEGVAWFSRNGSQTVHLPFEVTGPGGAAGVRSHALDDAVPTHELVIGARTYTLRSDDRFLQGFSGTYDPQGVKLMDSLLRDADRVADIGANVGCTALLFAQRAGLVHAFEPAPSTFGLLQRNALAHDNIRVYNFGLGDAPGVSQLTFAANDRSGGFVSDKTGGLPGHVVESIEIRRLDDIDIGRVDLMKIDVEGFELHALRGARRTLERDRPVVTLEMNHWCLNVFQRTSLPDFLDFLRMLFPILLAVDEDTYLDLHDAGQSYAVMYAHVLKMKFPALVAAFDEQRLQRFRSEYRKG
jgi:FkbM family methyltransferase